MPSRSGTFKRPTHDPLSDGSKLNFIGHIEGNQLVDGAADVVVCEGFVGNVVLKVAEGLYELSSQALQVGVGNRHPVRNRQIVADVQMNFVDGKEVFDEA